MLQGTASSAAESPPWGPRDLGMRKFCGVAGVLPLAGLPKPSFPPSCRRCALASWMSCSLGIASLSTLSFKQPCVCSQAARSSLRNCSHLWEATRLWSKLRAASTTAEQISSRSVAPSGQSTPHSAHRLRRSATVKPRAPLAAAPANSDRDHAALPADAGAGARARGMPPPAAATGGCLGGQRQRAASWARRRPASIRASKASWASRKRSAASGRSHLSGCHCRACLWKARLISASPAS
mmetsp:Transcript_23732/g.74876  ORF Transcript_23732/g.74876 Transcript_23732/m.74876 type:complete len:239 (+) Transcript_23732:714-1430(+)